MTVTYGFYDSVSGDRAYTSLQFGSLFDGIVADGIFQSIGGALSVSPGTGMAVNVAIGRAWFDHTWIDNDAILSVTIDTAEIVYDRIDTIVVETNSDPATRANTIKVVKGTPASTPVAPTLTNSGYIHQYPLANVYVAANVTSFVSGNITNRIGTDTPFSTGILETLNVSWLFAQWDDQFDTWFTNLVDQLTGTQVTNLQNQIDAIVENSPYPGYKNLFINGDLSVWQRGTSKTGVTALPGYMAGVADRWAFDINGAGTYTVQQNTDSALNGFGFHTQKFSCTVAKGTLSASDYVIFKQIIEGNNLKSIQKGYSTATDITVSFWVKSNLTSTFIAELYDKTNSRTISRSFTIASAGTWQFVELTFPGDTNSAGILNLNNSGELQFGIWLAAGSNYSSGTLQTSWGTRVQANRAVGTGNLSSSTSNYIEFGGLQAEAASNASLFEQLPYDITLHRCKRYFQVLADHANGLTLVCNGFFNTGTIIRGLRTLDVQMRADPTLYATTGTDYYIEIGGNDTFDAIDTVGGVDPSIVNIRGLTNLTGTAGNPTLIFTNASGAYVSVDAEL